MHSLFIETAVDGTGKHDQRSEFADDETDGDRDGRASRNAGPTASWATGRTAGHRADQQAEHQGERGSPDGDEIGPWAASLTARLARSPASAAPTATITPATACVDRS